MRSPVARRWWVECGCPEAHVDWDIDGVPSPDAVVPCAHCGLEHRLGDVGHLLRQDEGEEVIHPHTEREWRFVAETFGRP